MEEAELGVPLTVQGVIASRIDRLPLREKRLLQVAAAIGPKVPSRLLQAISAAEESVFRPMLTALLTAGMLVGSPEAGQGETSFPHECVRQVAYDATLESDRVNLHKRILVELEAEAAPGPNGPDLAAIRIHHAVHAKEWARAAELAAAVARRCFGQSAFSDAKRHYELAIASVDKLPPSPSREAIAIDLRIEARMAYGNLGLVSRWLDLAKEAEARALASGDHLRRVPALAMRAAALNFCGAPSEAIETGEAAVREAARSGERGWLAYAEYGLGQARFVAGNYREAVEALERAYRGFRLEGAAPPPGASGAQAALLSCMMMCASEVALGDDDGATAAQARADEIAAETASPAAAIAAGFSRGVLLLSRDDVKAAEATLTQSLKLARQHEVNLFIPVLANQHGITLLQLGQIEQAREAFQTAHREAEGLGHRSAELRAELGLALCAATSPTGRTARDGGGAAAASKVRSARRIPAFGAGSPARQRRLARRIERGFRRRPKSGGATGGAHWRRRHAARRSPNARAHISSGRRRRRNFIFNWRIQLRGADYGPGDEHDAIEQAANVNRRNVLVGGAAAAAISALPGVAAAQSKSTDGVNVHFGAIYKDVRCQG